MYISAQNEKLTKHNITFPDTIKGPIKINHKQNEVKGNQAEY